MPPLIAGVVVALAYIGMGAAGAIAWTTALVMAVVSIASAAASYALQGKSKAPGFSSLSGQRMVTSRDSVRARNVIYGTMRTGGVVAFMGSWYNKEWMALVIVLAGHEVTGIDEVYFGDELAFDAAGVKQGRFVDIPGGPVVALEKHLGTDDQTASSILTTYLSSYWTSDHRLRGCAYIVVGLHYSPSLFRTVPNITAIVRGKKVYDPRTATTVFSANPALCVSDYLTDTRYGLGVTYATGIAATELIAAANICDEDVEIPGSVYEDRYACNGILSSSEDPQTNLEMLLTSMAGRANFVGGQWVIRAGAYETPTITLTDADFRGNVQVQTRQQRRDLCNAVRGVFVSPERSWQLTDFTPLTSSAFEAQDNSERIWRDVELPFTTSHTMAQRLAKIELYACREQIALSVPVSLIGLRLRGGDTVAVTHSRFGWTAKSFVITDWSIAATRDSQGAPVLGCNLALRETSSAVYDVTASEQDIIEVGPENPLPDGYSVADIDGLTITTDNQIATDGTVVHRLKLTWTAHADAFVFNGGWIEIGYKDHADSDYIVLPTIPGDSTVAYIGPLIDGILYDVRIRAANVHGALSVWVFDSATAGVDETVPAAPTSVTVTAGFQQLTIQWTSPTDPDLDLVEIWRSTTNDSAGAVKVGEHRGIFWTDTGLVNGTTYYYWLKGRDTAGNVSGFHATQYAGASGTTSYLYVDDSLIGPANLGYNLDFEQGEIGWTLGTGWNHQATGGRNNSRCVSFDGTGQQSISNALWFPVEPGHPFYAEAWIWSAGGTNGTAAVSIGFADGANQWVSGVNGNAITGGNSSPQKSFVCGKAPASAKWGWIYVYGENRTTGYFLVDDCYISRGVAADWLLVSDAIIKNTAQIQDAIITSAKISDLAADKITAGTIGALSINVGDGKIKLDGANKRITANDGTRDRVYLGDTSGSGAWGLKVYDTNGAVQWDLTGAETAGVKPNAITAYVQTATGGPVTWTNTKDSWARTEVISHNHTVVANGPVLIVGMTELRLDASGGNARIDYLLTIRRGTTNLHQRRGTLGELSQDDWAWHNVTWSYIDAPGDGTHAYNIYVEVYEYVNTSSGSASLIYLQTIELKR